MARWTPDPTFYPSPRLAGGAPAEKFAYVALLEPDQKSAARRPRRDRPRARLELVRQIVSTARDAERGRRAAPLRLERVQRRALPVGAAPARRAPLPDRPGPALVADPRHRHQARPAARPRSSSTIEPEELIARTGYSRPHTTHCGPDAIYMIGARRTERRRRGRRASSCSTASRSTRSAPGRSTAGRRSSRTTSGGTSATTRCSRASGDRRRCSSRASCPRSCSAGSTATPCTSGTCATRKHLQHARPRRRAPDGARAAPGARPAQGVRLRRRGRLGRGPVGLGLALAPRRRRLEDPAR